VPIGKMDFMGAPR